MKRTLLISFKDAFKGIFENWKQRNFKIICFQFFLTIFLAIIFKVPLNYFLILCVSSGNIIIIEMINTSIETLCNFFFKERNETARAIKDIAAGATLVSVIIFLGVVLLILVQMIS